MPRDLEYDIFGGSSIKHEIKKLETTKCTPMDVITMVTKLKCIESVLNNGNIFYGVYETKIKPDGKKGWTNLIAVFLNENKLPQPSQTSTKIITTKLMSLSVNECLWPLATMFTYSVELLEYSWFIAKSQSANPRNVLLALEKMIPKKKYYIKSAKSKSLYEKDKKLINSIAKYFKINDIEAEQYLDMLEHHPQYDEFVNEFKQEGKQSKLKRRSK